MKERTISAIIMLMIVVPILIIGGLPFKIGVYLLAIFGLKEFIDVKSVKKEIPLFVKFISYIIMTLIIFGSNQTTVEILLDYRIVAAAFLVYLIPIILYHDNKTYSVSDAFFLLGSVFFLGISFGLLILIRNENIHLLVYLLLVTASSDTFAYITGKLVGKNKLLEEISPKKTWEGSIGGTIMSVFIGIVFYKEIIDPNISMYIILITTLFLSVISQFGDLVFSSIKRYYGKKDFSNLMPGHGGILDRMDSIIFALIGYIFFINFL